LVVQLPALALPAELVSLVDPGPQVKVEQGRCLMQFELL
jgi:hypothetical protein